MTAHVVFELDAHLLGVPVDEVARFEDDKTRFAICLHNGERWHLTDAPALREVGEVAPVPPVLSNWALQVGVAGFFRDAGRLGVALSSAWQHDEADTDEVSR